MKKVLLTLFLTVAAMITTSAQTRNFGIREGLSNGFVDDMVIDGQGFVWVATEWGLNRIAGNKCTVFYPSNSAITNNEHVGLFYHPQSNTVWVHSKDGRADIFNCKTQTFSHFEVDGKTVWSIADICMAADSTIWLADYNGGVHHYTPLTKEHEFIDAKQIRQIANGVRSITDDGKGNLYIGLRMEGLIIYNTHTKRSRYFKNNPEDPTSLPGDNVRSVCIDHLQNIWVGTNKGLALFDPLKGTFHRFKHEKGNPNTLAGDNIQQIIESPDNIIWISSDIGGISKLDLNKYSNPNAGEVAFTQLTKENYTLSSNNTRRVAIDAYGNVWVANYSTGVDFIPSSTTSFMTLSFMGEPIEGVSAIFNDSKDNLWIGQDNKISMYRQGAIVRQWDFSQYISNSSSSVYLFREDQHGNIWLGTADNGVLMLNPNTGIFTRFNSTKDLDVNALYVDKSGKVWAGTEDGVYSIYNNVESKENAINGVIGNSSIPFSIIEDDYGQMWIGTLARGIFVFDKNKKLMAHLGDKPPFPSNSVNQLIKDEDGGIWAATHCGLVYFPNAQTPNNFKTYGEEQGISDNHIRSLVQDRQGNIWVSMFSGIACFDRQKKKFYNYDYQSGIPTGNFCVGAAVISASGIVYFGSPGGICSFNPQLLTDLKDMPVVQIIDCEQIVSTTEKQQRIIVPLDENGVAHLRHDENTFKITFTSDNYAQEGNVEYSYLMKGLDDKWYETEGDNEVTFRNLSPGEYTFKVRAKLKSQEWENAKVAEMKVIVEPPLWLTWWAKLIYALIVGGISKKALPHIYERYYQAKGLHQASGTGIGLALVKSFAKLHEAELKVESEEGMGTEFRFVLDAENTYPNALHKEDAPIEEEKQEVLAQEEISEPEEEQEDARPLILVVEDNDDIRQYIDESLCEDYRIIQARNGKEGRDQAFQEMPALIVSDIMMPEMDGIEMMKILKNDIRTSHIPIILLTAKTSPLDQEEGYDSGADSYLMKPFSAKLLQSRIRNILSGRRRLAEYIIQHIMPSAAGMSTLTSSAGEASGQQSLEEAELAASILELSPLDKKFMEKLNRLIEENMTTVDIDIAFMTDKMAMSHSSFYRKVKALTGVSANEYIRKMKLQRSMVLLQEGESNVTEVAMLTGFNNIGYFRKCFKKEYGISPSEVLKGKQ